MSLSIRSFLEFCVTIWGRVRCTLFEIFGAKLETYRATPCVETPYVKHLAQGSTAYKTALVGHALHFLDCFGGMEDWMSVRLPI